MIEGSKTRYHPNDYYLKASSIISNCWLIHPSSSSVYGIAMLKLFGHDDTDTELGMDTNVPQEMSGFISA